MKKPVFLVLAAMIVGSSLGCSSLQGDKKMSNEDKAWMFLNMANGAITDGDFTGALQNLRDAEALAPKIPDIYHSRALAFYFKRDLDQALIAAQKALELNPDYVQANNTIGKILMDQGRTSMAVPYLARASKDPLNREAFKAKTNLGIIEYRGGNLEQAFEYLNGAITDAPHEACVAYYYRGHVHLQKNRLEAAIEDYGAASKRICGNFADAHLAQAMTFEKSQNFKNARKKYLEIQSLFPGTKTADQAMIHLRKLP